MIKHARRWGAAVVVAAVVAALSDGGPASAVTTSDPIPDGTYAFTAKVMFGDVRACSGALIDAGWVITAKSCVAEGAEPVAPGAPARPTTVTVGGAERTVVSVVPHPERNLALLRLYAPVTGVGTVALDANPPAATDTVQVAGYGRTATEWVPDRPHAADFIVQAVTSTTVDVAGAAALCRGDAGAPVVRAGAVVAVTGTSWQKGCLAVTETRDGGTASRVDDLGPWIREQIADVQIYGVLADGRLTYSVIDSASGTLRADRQSAATLGFTPKTMATLNADTILVTETSGNLYRVDVTDTNPLTFTTAPLGSGWSVYDRMTYDGYGSLYYINSANELFRRTVTAAKPTAANIARPIKISAGFSHRAIASPAPGRILGNVADGRLMSYKINGGGTVEPWYSSTLKTTGWAGYTHVLSPGGGVYYGRTPAGRLDRFVDANPLDGSGADLQSFATPVSTGGWAQILLSARPWASLVSVFGVRPDGHITYTALDPVTGAKAVSTVSAQTLGFTPKALATLNSDTLLVTTTAGDLYRVDITGTQPLTFTRTAQRLGGGWTHDRLVYDGYGTLFGQAGGKLIRYTVTKPKPANPATDLINRFEVVASGFGVFSLAATGKGHLLATDSAGTLIAYTVDAAGDWSRANLATGWTGLKSIVSPGGGLYYRRDGNGVLTGFIDVTPFDGVGSDLTANAPTGSTGWDAIISAQPYDAWPDSTRRPAVSGVPAPAVEDPNPATGTPIAEDFSYPGAEAILADQNIKLLAGDGHILLVDCATPTTGDIGLLKVWTTDDTVGTDGLGRVCFRISAAKAWLTLEIPGVYEIRGDGQQTGAGHEVRADLKTDTGEAVSVDVDPDGSTQVGQGASPDAPPTMLLRLTVTA